MAEIIEYVGLAFIPLFLLADLVYRHRKFDTTRWWRLRGLLATVGALVVSTASALFWAGVIGERSLLNLSSLGTIGGAAVGIVGYEILHYGYHRTAHTFGPLWRFHQMHHSAEALDAFGANYIHPVDLFFFTTWSSLVFFPVLGLSATAGATAAAFVTFNAMFQHANIRTPRWLGAVIQRPEMHGVHHQRGVHLYNFSDLPVLDMLFGTYRNPATWDAETGFYKGASSRIGAMLVGKDVTVKPVKRAEEETVGAAEQAA